MGQCRDPVLPQGSLREPRAEQAAFKAKFGYDLAPPADWQQFRDVAIFFTRDTDSDGKTDLYGTDVKGANSGGMDGRRAAGRLARRRARRRRQRGHRRCSASRGAGVLHWSALRPITSAPKAWCRSTGATAQNLFYQGQTAMMRFWAHAYRLTPEDFKVAGQRRRGADDRR